MGLKDKSRLFTNRENGAGRVYIYPSPLGTMSMTCDGMGLTSLTFAGQKYAARSEAKSVKTDVNGQKLPQIIAQTVRWLNIYFAGGIPDFTPPLSLNGSPFRKEVWNILLTIPYGKTLTYGQIAARIAEEEGRPRMSAQAVGGAVGHNPVAIIVPCHRVIGADGSLTGYAGGLDKKTALLKIESGI